MNEHAVFHESTASLAEGLLVDDIGKQVLWVDIDDGRVFRKSFDGSLYREYRIGGQPSALLTLNDSALTLCDNQGLKRLNLETGEIHVVSENPDSAQDSNFRSNDGIVLATGELLYGTMECAPTGINGGLYIFDGRDTKSLNTAIGIPNAFVLLDDAELLIADSYTKRINLFQLDVSTSAIRLQRCWHDFSITKAVPDGGCIDENGNVYIALWDGFGIAVLDTGGELLRVLSLPVPRPTNCKLAGRDKLYVTTARTGLTDTQLDEYPLSGSVLEVGLA
jgi:sugar lactone lactonase YvrE